MLPRPHSALFTVPKRDPETYFLLVSDNTLCGNVHLGDSVASDGTARYNAQTAERVSTHSVPTMKHVLEQSHHRLVESAPQA